MDLSFPTFRRLSLPWGPWHTTRAQSQALLRLIAVASEESLPLAPLLSSWAADERGVHKRRLLRLVRLLEGGASLPTAVEEVAGVLRDEDLLAIRFDAQSGTRTAAIRALLDNAPSAATRLPGVRETLVYFSIVAPIGLLVVAFLQIKIAPVYSRILEGFAVREPDVLRWSHTLNHVFLEYWWLFALVFLAVLWTTVSTRTGKFVRRTLLGRLFNPWRTLHVADVLQKLGLASSVGRPIAGVLSTLARFHFDPVIRNKLLFVRNEVEQGVDIWQSMTAVGLLSPPERHLLETAERVGNRPWVLEQLARGKVRRAQRKWQQIGVFLLPALVIAMGGFVLFQALSIFLPLTEILRAL